MIIRCEHCGEKIEIADDTSLGQHIRCPFCDRKFSYRSGVDVSTEDLRTALNACRRDPAKNAYYSHAPAGARLYIATLFYAQHFREFVTAETVSAILTEIEPELNAQDVQYLLQHETDDDMIAYLRNLSANVAQSEAASATGAPRKTGVRQPAREGILVTPRRKDAGAFGVSRKLTVIRDETSDIAPDPYAARKIREVEQRVENRLHRKSYFHLLALREKVKGWIVIVALVLLAGLLAASAVALHVREQRRRKEAYRQWCAAQQEQQQAEERERQAKEREQTAQAEKRAQEKASREADKAREADSDVRK